MEREADALERRREFRLGFRIPMRYRKLESSAQDFRGSLMRDISQGGVSMSIFEFLPIDLRLATEIPLISGARPIRGVGRVAWVRKAGYSEQYDIGIEFTGMDQEESTQLNEFISWRKAEEIR